MHTLYLLKSFAGMNMRFYKNLSAGIFFALIFSLICIAATMGKAETFLLLNNHHSLFADTFFIYFTFLGDGLFSIVTGGIVFFIICKKTGYKIIIAYIISGILAQVLKKLFHFPRPKAFFQEGVYKHFLDGVTYTGWNSFPSGHSTSIFALATVLCLNTKNILLRITFMLIAFTIGYSRIYLGQHFLEDVVAGAVLGSVSGFVIYKFLPFPTLKRRRQEEFSMP